MQLLMLLLLLLARAAACIPLLLVRAGGAPSFGGRPLPPMLLLLVGSALPRVPPGLALAVVAAVTPLALLVEPVGRPCAAAAAHVGGARRHLSLGLPVTLAILPLVLRCALTVTGQSSGVSPTTMSSLLGLGLEGRASWLGNVPSRTTRPSALAAFAGGDRYGRD